MIRSLRSLYLGLISPLLLGIAAPSLALPSLACGPATNHNNLSHWLSACHYSDQAAGAEYHELAEDVAVHLRLPSTVNPQNLSEVRAAMAQSLVYVDGINASVPSTPQAPLQQYIDQGAALIHIAPGISSTESLEDYADKVQQILRDIQTYRQANANNQDLVLIGFSLGGVASRIALREMELNAEAHHTGLYISYDAPHTGAAMPQAVQQLVLLFEGFLHKLSNLLPSQAGPLQGVFNGMKAGFDGLANSLSSIVELAGVDSAIMTSLAVDNPYAQNGEYESFQQYLTTLGLPQQPLNIAVANGDIYRDDDQRLSQRINSEQAGASYYYFYGEDNLEAISGQAGEADSSLTSGSSFIKLSLKPSQANHTVAFIEIGATIQQQSWYSCFIEQICTHANEYQHSIPYRIDAGSEVLDLDTVPGSYRTDVANIFSGLSSLSLMLEESDYTNQLGRENNFAFTFIPTSSAFALAVGLSESQLIEAYQNHEHSPQSPFDKLIAIAQESTEPQYQNKNLLHDNIIAVPAWTDEVDAILGVSYE